ncbi:hypothetical protein HY571_01785 [Candidatus Micrarchaeota archaeon]|nr:hypothetical protein [Candidatus Micrarchaeota archaeon]
MSQFVEFNETLKVDSPEKFEVGKHYWIIRGGYKVYPMIGSIDLMSKEGKKIGRVRVKQVNIKFQEFLTDEDAAKIGLERATQLAYFLEMENPAEGQVATFVEFERTE